MSIKDLIRTETHKHLGSKMSSGMAFQIHATQLALKGLATVVDPLERIASALEAIARGAGATLPSDGEIARKKAAELAAKRKRLAAELAELGDAGDEDLEGAD